MAKKTGHQDKVEPVTNCDRLPNNKVIVTAPIESRIITIRGKQIMIDRDLAELYGVETKTLNQAVKRKCAPAAALRLRRRFFAGDNTICA